MGLALNHNKTEIHLQKSYTVRGTILCSLPGVQIVSPEKATLLGLPLGDAATIVPPSMKIFVLCNG